MCVSVGDYCKVNLCHNGGTCVTGIGEDPFFCICAEGFAGDTCNATENGQNLKCCLSEFYWFNPHLNFRLGLNGSPYCLWKILLLRTKVALS